MEIIAINNKILQFQLVQQITNKHHNFQQAKRTHLTSEMKLGHPTLWLNDFIIKIREWQTQPSDYKQNNQ